MTDKKKTASKDSLLNKNTHDDYILLSGEMYPIAKVVKFSDQLVWVLCPFCNFRHMHQRPYGDDIRTRVPHCEHIHTPRPEQYCIGRVPI